MFLDRQTDTIFWHHGALDGVAKCLLPRSARYRSEPSLVGERMVDIECETFCLLKRKANRDGNSS